ncbi:hypothetical protein O0235_10290 [Tepidiforma flava]|uniref:Uncharacterized protein n=1 Tax=Tepidiforma flava TaxID=3004094 RepID=A0ABY7M4C2_9CHLR|nr:hypothetical protein [Tepidiforma flava]WBL35177.1 hypothetical protein O0235_10290 [Tepidiforma flava]
MAATAHRTRCSACGRALPFADWTRGRPLCEPCARPAAARRAAPPVPAPPPPADDLVDTVPDALIDELVAALEAEAAKLDQASPLAGVLAELELGRTPRERHWAAWGFAAGFALNAGIAKWAQVASGAPISDFLAPILIGGVVAGATCAAIAWGIARLRQPA